MRLVAAEVLMDSALKQRLLGAAVLLALAVIFVPMFLGSSPQKETSTIQNLDIPPIPERKFETRTLPVDGSAATPAPEPASPDKVVTVDTRAPSTFEAPEPGPAKPAASAAAPPAPAAPPAATPAAAAPPGQEHAPTPAKTSEPAAPSEPPAAEGRFSVNLGVYADSGHANALVKKLKQAGFMAYAETTDYKGKPAQRVRVGPFADRAAAEAARLKIKQTQPKVPSSVTESVQQPTADAPASALAPNRAGAWAVQLGAFKSQDEAAKLRDRIKALNIAAFVDRTGSGDEALWRVRAGPYAERSAAESARASLKQRLQTDGIVVTQP
jgi:DedD protein